MIALWQATQALTDQLFANHQFNKLVIEVTHGRWEDYYAQIRGVVIPGFYP